MIHFVRFFLLFGYFMGFGVFYCSSFSEHSFQVVLVRDFGSLLVELFWDKT